MTDTREDWDERTYHGSCPQCDDNIDLDVQINGHRVLVDQIECHCGFDLTPIIQETIG